MTDDRVSGIALIAGLLGAIVTMVLHPTGHDFFVPGQFAQASHFGIAAHTMALVSLPVSFLGAVGLSWRSAPPGRLALAAPVMYAFAIVAVMNAAVVSGLVAPNLAPQILQTTPDRSEAWQLVFLYNGQLNQAFARVFVVVSSTAIVFWSSSIVRGGVLPRGIGIYGLGLGPVTTLAVLSGHLNLDVHGLGWSFSVKRSGSSSSVPRCAKIGS